MKSRFALSRFVGIALLCMVAVRLLAGPIPANKPATYPDWWFERDVILRLNPNNTTPAWPQDYPIADDYAASNQGQVKNIAYKAAAEMQSNGLIDATSSIMTMVTAWDTAGATTDDYRIINLGQLKNLAEPFYARLEEAGYTGQPLAPGQTRPWSGTADDYALANIGQVKNLFSFTLSLFPDALVLVGGNQQMGPSGQILPQPLRVKVINSLGLPMTGVMVTFTVTPGAGALGSTSGGASSSTESAITGLDGKATVYAKVNGSAGAVNIVTASREAQTVRFTEYVTGEVASTEGNAQVPGAIVNAAATPGGTPNPPTSDQDPSWSPFVPPIAYVTIDPGDSYDYDDPTWVRVTWWDPNNSGGVDRYIVERRVSSGEWIVLTPQPIDADALSDGPLQIGHHYEYRVTAVDGDRKATSQPVSYNVPVIKGIKISTAHASGEKWMVAFSEFNVPPTTPPAAPALPKYYLVKTDDFTWIYSSKTNYSDGTHVYYFPHDEHLHYVTTNVPEPDSDLGWVIGSLEYSGSGTYDEASDILSIQWPPNTGKTETHSHGTVDAVTGEWIGTTTNISTYNGGSNTTTDGVDFPGGYWGGGTRETTKTLDKYSYDRNDSGSYTVASDHLVDTHEFSDEYTTAGLEADTKAAYTDFSDFQDLGYYWNWYYGWLGGEIAHRSLNEDEDAYSISKGRYKFQAYGQNGFPIKWLEVFIADDPDPDNPTPVEDRLTVGQVRTWTAAGESETYDSPDGADAVANGTYYLMMSPELHVYSSEGNEYDHTEKIEGSIPVYTGSYSTNAGTTFSFDSDYYIPGFTFEIKLSEGSNLHLYGWDPYNHVWTPLGLEYSFESDDDYLMYYGALYSSFKIATNENGQNADSVVVSLKVTSPDGTVVTNDTAKFTYVPPELPPVAMEFPAEDASGAKYRKVALNGRPLSDEKPQQAAESDQQPEETFVDAMTLGLRHNTTDLYAPVAGSDLSLSVRRNTVSEVWNYRNGLRPHERPDLPFGLGWSSNIAASAHFSTDGDGVTYVYITDENGSSFRFLKVHDASYATSYIPFPSSKNEQAVYQTKLDDAGGYLVFSRKYGTTLSFEYAGIYLPTSADRMLGSDHYCIDEYSRLASVSDRLGQTLIYSYESEGTLIPTTIEVQGRSDQKIQIQQNEQGQITAVWDANLNKTEYGYSTYQTTGEAVNVLTSVTTADGKVTRYTYDFSNEADLTPKPAGSDDPQVIYTHGDVNSIKDPLGNLYQFTYMLDHDGAGLGRYNYKVDSKHPEINGYYITTGHPRLVESVQLPNGEGTTHFKNFSVLKLQQSTDGLTTTLANGNVRKVEVDDVAGNAITYSWGSAAIYKVNAITKDQPRPMIAYYRTMDIQYGLLGHETFSFDENAGLALSGITDFCGNTTSYAHVDAWTVPPALYREVIDSDSGLNGFYDDPTSQTNALGKTKTFTYDASTRIMASSTDEAGVKTQWTVDSLGRRTEEQIFAAGSTTAIQDTAFTYGSEDFPGFMTRKTAQKLTGVTDPTWVTDLVTAYAPDANGRVAQEITDSSGLHLVTAYTYDANGNKLTSTDPRGNVTAFSYDKRNRLVAVTYADHTQKQFFYDARGNKTEEIDENGVASFWQYDALNRVVTQIVDMDGSLKTQAAATHVLTGTAVSYRATGHHLVTSTTYDNLNKKLTETDPRGHTTTLAYDALQRLTSKTDALDHTTTYEYDVTKNCGGSVFDSSGFKPTTVIDPRDYHTQVTYDALYRPVTEKAEYQTDVYATTTKAYDDVGNLIQVTAPRATGQTSGTITKTTYDALRRPVAASEAFGTSLIATSTKDYTSTGLVWKTTDPLARETRTEYDAAARPVKTFAPAVDDALTTDTALVSPVTETRYDVAGNVSYSINPLGRRTDYAYDTRNRRITEQLPAVFDASTGQITRPTRTTAYDLVGNVIAAQDARGFIARTTYDPARRPLTVTAPPVTLMDGTVVNPVTSTTYDQAGNVLTVTDANGHVTTNTYDDLNRLHTTADAAGITVTHGYDAVGNRIDVWDDLNQHTAFTYDGLNRNLAVADPAGNAVTFTYDAINKTTRVDGIGQSTSYTYDARHRLTDVAYAGRSADNRSYGYDADNELLSVTEPGKAGKADVAYSYDALGRQLTETSGGKTHAYAYDLAGNRVTVTYGGTGTVLASTYDELNRLGTLSETPAPGAQLPTLTYPRVTTYGYDLNGNRVLQQMPDGETVNTQFDALNRQTIETTTKAGTGTLVLHLTQAYDSAGNVEKITERHFGASLEPRTITNAYDGINRLVSETTVKGALTTATAYTYDAAHNRTQKAVATTVGTTTTTVGTTYTYNALNQLQTESSPAGVRTYTYDLNGDRATVSFVGSSNAPPLVDTYGYDYENRLVSLTKATLGGAGTYAYVYDYRTRRVERSETIGTTTVTQSVFSGGLSVAEYDSQTPAVVSAEFIRGSDWGGGVGGLLYSVRAGQPSFKHYNSRGDVVTATNGAAAATWQATYEAFGTRTQETGTTQDRQKANTKEEDPTGLLNEGFRYRDLETGSFITRDPLGFVDGPNMYAYVVQNPWTKFDPEGLEGKKGRAPNDDSEGVEKTTPVRLQNKMIKTDLDAKQAERDLAKARSSGDKAKIAEAETNFNSAKKTSRQAQYEYYKLTGEENRKLAKQYPENSPGRKRFEERAKVFEDMAATVAPKSSDAARIEVMNKEGIPASQQPESQSQNESGREYTYKVAVPGGGAQLKSVQQQTKDESHPDQPHWEAGKVKTDPQTGEVRMDQYGRPKLENNKSKADYDE